MRLSIITPSFNQSGWLKLCVASVADQGVELEHIVQDAGSTDGTLDWLAKDNRVKPFVEPDRGMYDAINRGLRRATGEIVAYLNCDEQYLPDALDQVDRFFSAHPDVDVVFGDAVVVDQRGQYRCSRQVLRPRKYHTWVCHLATLTCATFFRRRLLDQHALFFNPDYRFVGDSEWMLRALALNVCSGALRSYTSVFTETGTNLTLSEEFTRERDAFYRTAPVWALWARPAFVLHHRLRRLLAGLYSPRPFCFSLYTPDSPGHRITRVIDHPTFRWKEWQKAPAPDRIRNA